MKKIIMIATVFTLLLSIVTCTEKIVTHGGGHESSKNPSPWLYIDEWFSSPSDGSGAGINEWKEVGFFEVIDPMQEYAQSVLKERSFYIIECDKVNSFTDSRLIPEPNKKCFIVRSLYLNAVTGGFQVEFNGNDLWVGHESLGRRPRVMKKKALIVLLPHEPKNVYVTCDMYE